MNRVNLAALNGLVPETRVAALPFLFHSVDHMHKVKDGPAGDKILAAMEKHGLIGLAFQGNSARSFYNSKRPINRLEDHCLGARIVARERSRGAPPHGGPSTGYGHACRRSPCAAGHA
ncbi:TRAP-type C4-dicarboxylate transport system, periplasmic component [Azospirillum largimobile]